MKNVFAIAFLVVLSMLPIQMAVGNDLPTNNHLRTVLRPLHDPDYRIQGDNISDFRNGPSAVKSLVSASPIFGAPRDAPSGAL